MSVDMRTRWDDDVVAACDAAAFFGRDLPAAFEREAALLTTTAGLDLRPVAFVVDGRSWTLWRDAGATIRVEPTSAATPEIQETLRLSPSQLSDLVADQVTPVGLMTAGTLDLDGGRVLRIMDWWLVLRCVIDRRAVFTPGSVVIDSELRRAFTLGDEPDELRAFLETNGFLHLRGVFDESEMGRVSLDMDELAPSYTADDGNSWWATLGDGTRRVVRMQRFEQRSPAAAALLDDPRFLALGALTGCGHSQAWSSGNRLEALFKPVGVAEGISDVPWHKDCSLGRHSYQCCSLTVGISVTGAGPSSGQLRVVAGSHRALVWPSLLDPSGLGLPDVALPTVTGDVTVHLSCTLHMAQPPTARERKVLYTGFSLPPRNIEAAAAAQRRLMLASRESAPRTTSQSLAKSR